MALNDIDLQRLRATLRLIFKPEQADALASRLDRNERDPVGMLAPVARMARFSYGSGRWLAPFRAPRDPNTMPLRPRLTLPALPALALAFHLGLDLEIDQLALLFERDPKEISATLQSARRAVDPTHVGPCPEFLTAIGRYRDPTPDRIERLELMQHLEGCGRCQLALEHARRTDDDLLAAIDRHEARLAPLSGTVPSGRPVWLGPLLLWGGIAIVALLVVAAVVTGSHRLLSHDQTPVALLSATTPAPVFDGWLLQTTRAGLVEAVNLGDGLRRVLVPSDPSASSVDVSISPDRKRIAEMSYTSANYGQTLRVYSIEGVKQREWTGLETTGQLKLLGWLNSGELLVSRLPARAAGEAQAAYDVEATKDSALLAFYIDTGNQQVLLQAEVDSAYAAPDGRHVAVNRVEPDGSITLELRPLEAGRLGDPTASFANATFRQSGSLVLWTPDSQRVVFWARSDVQRSNNTTPFVVMTLDGQNTTIHQAPGNAFGALLAISPDGKQVVYAEGETGTTTAPWGYWGIDVSGGDPVELLNGGNLAAVRNSGRGWSPVAFVDTPSGNRVAISADAPFYLPEPQAGSIQTSVTSYVTLAVDATGKSVGPMLDQFTPRNLLAWLPADALAATQANTTSDTRPFSQQGKVEGIPELTADSRLSPDGTSVLAYDRRLNFSMAVSLTNPAGFRPQTAGVPEDPSWLPDGSGVIGVQRHNTGNGRISRISIYGDIGFGNLAPTDFDPAQLGQRTSASYHSPMLSPNGLRYSFFVVDGSAVAVWVGGYDIEPRIVASWTLPKDPKVELPYLSSWDGNDTLIFAEPDDWVKGFPRHVSLERVTVANGIPGNATPVVSWDARGGEKGITLRELRLSPDGTHLAFRLRRYTGTNLTTDRFDAVSIARTDDLNQAVEVARGVAGDGMNWSPAGTELAAFVGGHLQIATYDRSHTQTVDTGNVICAYPVWVRPDEIWYQAIGSGGQSVSYTLRATR